MIKLITILLFTMSITNLVFSQTGPGGIGVANGSSNLDIWLRDLNTFSDAGTSTSTNGSLVQQWNDASGNGNNAIQTTISLRPVYVSNLFNGYPAMEFTTEELIVNYDINPSANNTITIIAALDHNLATSTPLSKFFGHDNGGYDRCIGFDNRCSPETFNYYAGPTTKVDCYYTPIANTRFITSNTYTLTNFTGWINGNPIVNSLGVDNGVGETSFAIGNSGQTYNEYWNGAIGEFMIFNRSLNTAEQIIIHNYLSAKYDVTMANNDIYDEDNLGNGNYDHDVAGIGQALDGSNHTDAQGTGIVRISNPSSLGNNEFLMWGHDNGLPQAIETTDIPIAVEARFDRVWRVSETNTSGAAINVGNVNIRFDLAGLGAVTASDLRLLVDSDNDNTFTDETLGSGGVISGATSLGGNIYQFTAVSALVNNLRFTLATTDASQTPLPIELLNFTVTPTNKNQAKLDWQTISEINNDYFSIERSLNAIDWEKLYDIGGAGNSNSLLSYQSFDLKPHMGTSYYRLKQTDFDGNYSYSQIRILKLKDDEFSEIKIFPNPAKNKITITGRSLELRSLVVFNVLGQDVTALTQQMNNEETKKTIEISRLSKGVYYIKTQTTATKIYKQ